MGDLLNGWPEDGEPDKNHTSVRLTGFCPECGDQMKYCIDPKSKPYIANGENPGDFGCEEDSWICMSCMKEFALIYEIPDGR